MATRVRLYACGGEHEANLAEYPLGLGYLKSNSPAGHDVQIVKSREELVDCDLIGLSSAAWGLSEAVEILRGTDIPVVIGGQGTLWEGIDGPFYKIVEGEGELAWRMILDYDEHSTPCILDRRYVDFMHPKHNIDDLNFPDRGKCGPVVPILTARGCPWNCHFCTAKAQWGGVRYHSVDYVMEEVEYILKTYPETQGLYILDDLFAADEERLGEVYAAWMKRGYEKRLSLHGFVRSNTFTTHMGAMMAGMGFTSIRFGGESGSDAVLQRLNKCATVEDHQRTIDIATSLQLHVGASFMYGVPGETEEERQATELFVAKQQGNPYWLGKLGWYKFAAWPGTKLWDGSSPLEVDMRVR